MPVLKKFTVEATKMGRADLDLEKIWERDAETLGDNLTNSSKERDICISYILPIYSQ